MHMGRKRLQIAMTSAQFQEKALDKMLSVVNISSEALCCLQHMTDQTTVHCIHTVEPAKIQVFDHV